MRTDRREITLLEFNTCWALLRLSEARQMTLVSPGQLPVGFNPREPGTSVGHRQALKHVESADGALEKVTAVALEGSG